MRNYSNLRVSILWIIKIYYTLINIIIKQGQKKTNIFVMNLYNYKLFKNMKEFL